jgi:hypothetical protein
LKNIIVSSLALDKLNIENPNLWNYVERAYDKVLHKLSSSQIVTILELLNKKSNRVSREFSNKLITILPIHVQNLSDQHLIILIDICYHHDLANERLFKYFIFPRIENRISKVSFGNYIKILKLLSKLQYQEDLEFWNDYILPTIFKFEYSLENAETLWETFLLVKVSCPNVDISKHLPIIENIINQFKNLKESGQDVSTLLLKLSQDMTLIPKKKEEKISLKKVREAEKRLKDRVGLKAIMGEINPSEDKEQIKDYEQSLNKLLEIKDWKKVKYEMTQAEIKKMRQESLDSAKKMEEESELLKTSAEGEAEVITPESVDTTHKIEGDTEELEKSKP